jgi:prophage tail gpP-like protein
MNVEGKNGVKILVNKKVTWELGDQAYDVNHNPLLGMGTLVGKNDMGMAFVEMRKEKRVKRKSGEAIKITRTLVMVRQDELSLFDPNAPEVK